MLHSAGHFIRRCSSTLSRLRTAIKATGPLTVADYMKESLSNPLTGYYMKQTAIGKDGDFVTSPEISQVFGELLGVWIMADWMIQGQPNPCHVIELGPGNGSLINDIIRVFSQLKDILPAAVVHLVEISPRMKKRQQGLLNNSQNEQIDEDTICLPNGLIINWYSSLSSVPRGYSYYIAHEFFDVLPVHQFMKTKSNEWREVLVDIDTTAQNNEGDLRYVIAPGRTPALTYCSLLDENVREGEVSPQALMIMDEISKRVREFGGAALIADYGEENIDKFTLRAYKDHKQCHPLSQPGLVDLTTDVNFGLLKNIIKSNKCIPHGVITQNEFLHKMGIRQRIEMLLNNAEADTAKSLIDSYEWLTSPDKMGKKFKFLSLTNSTEHIPTPF